MSGSPSTEGTQPVLTPPHLTSRELEILGLVARSQTNRQIADALVISQNTVRNHIRNILDKLQMHSRMEAALFAMRRGLLKPDQ